MKVFHGNYGDGNQEGAMGRTFARMGYTPVWYKGKALVKRDNGTVSVVWPSWCNECYDQHDHTGPGYCVEVAARNPDGTITVQHSFSVGGLPMVADQHPLLK